MKTAGYFTAGAIVLVLGATGAMAQQGQGAGTAQDRSQAPMFLERFDTDGDGAVTQAEIDAVRAERFAQADADGDGFITAEEMASSARMQAEARMQERRATRAERMIARLDTDGDGRLSAEEAADGARMPVFARLDADGDGTITAEEMQQARDAMREDRRAARADGHRHMHMHMHGHRSEDGSGKWRDGRGPGRGDHDGRTMRQGENRGEGQGAGRGTGEGGMPWWLR